jgi:hypothetical protein
MYQILDRYRAEESAGIKVDILASLKDCAGYGALMAWGGCVDKRNSGRKLTAGVSLKTGSHSRIQVREMRIRSYNTGCI